MFTRKRIQHWIDSHDGLHWEADTFLRIVKHLADAAELVLVDEVAEEEIFRKLDGNLADIFRRAIVLLPYMFQLLASDQGQVIFADHLHRVAHNASDPFCIFNVIDFKFTVGMEGISKFRFNAVGNVEAVLVRQRSKLMQDMTVAIAHVVMVSSPLKNLFWKRQWSHLGLNQGLPDYESGALTN